MLFFKQRDGPYMPTLRLLHKCEFSFLICKLYHTFLSRSNYASSSTGTTITLVTFLTVIFYSHNKVDKGAIRFILSGANIMCPGLTSKGAKMETSLPPNTVVVSLLDRSP